MRRIASRLPYAFFLTFTLYGVTAREASAQQPMQQPAPAPAGAAAPPPLAPPPAPPMAAPPPAPPPPDLPPPPPAQPPTPVVTPPTPLPLPPAVPPPPPPPPSEDKPLRVGGAVRVGFRLQDPAKPKNMSEFHLDTAGSAYSPAAELRLGGDVTKYFGWVADFNALIDGDGAGKAAIAMGSGNTYADLSVEDLIAQFHPMSEFNIWVGRLLVPSDRSNFSGPFFMSPWNYPGFYFAGAPPLGPIEGPNGRNQGGTVWGNVADDKFKYYVGVYGIDQGSPNYCCGGLGGVNPFYSARLSYSLQGAEPGYFGASTYYGEKNVVTIGVGGQYQKDGTSGDTPTSSPKDTFMGMADILAEENVPGTGTFTFEGQFYKFNDGFQFGGPVAAPKEAFYALVSYLTPEPLGIGKLQPLVRWQQTIDPAWTIFDAALAYVVKAYNARIVATYEHIDTTKSTGGTIGNSLQLGIQLQK